MLDDYTMGKIAAHAYADELQRLQLGYEISVEKTAQGLLSPELQKKIQEAGKTVGQLSEKTTTAVPGGVQKVKGWVAPVARGGRLVGG